MQARVAVTAWTSNEAGVWCVWGDIFVLRARRGAYHGGAYTHTHTHTHAYISSSFSRLAISSLVVTF
jgi:hypothetical protein